jgi:hypothetical protein
MAGKGDKDRTKKFRKFWDNHDKIFSKPKKDEKKNKDKK